MDRGIGDGDAKSGPMSRDAKLTRRSPFRSFPGLPRRQLPRILDLLVLHEYHRHLRRMERIDPSTLLSQPGSRHENLSSGDEGRSLQACEKSGSFSSLLPSTSLTSPHLTHSASVFWHCSSTNSASKQVTFLRLTLSTLTSSPPRHVVPPSSLLRPLHPTG